MSSTQRVWWKNYKKKLETKIPLIHSRPRMSINVSIFLLASHLFLKLVYQWFHSHVLLYFRYDILPTSKPYVYCGADYFGIELEGTALVRVIISGTNQWHDILPTSKPCVYCGPDYFGIELEGTALVNFSSLYFILFPIYHL